MDRFGDKICCNPTVKLKKQESYPVIDIDKITPGYKAVRSVASIEYTGQGGAKFQDHDVLFARITPCLENGKMAIADTEGQNGIVRLQKAFDENNVVILSGAAGTGKTRLALEFAERFQKEHTAVKICVIHNHGLPIYDDLKQHFECPGDYFVIVDDANQLSQLDLIIEYVNKKDNGYNVRILATVRNYALQKVKADIAGIVHYSEVTLDSLSDDEIKSLVKDYLGIINRDYLNRIATIAEGNARIALIAGKVAVDANGLQSISDVTGLYEEYYGKAFKEANLDGDLQLQITAGVIAFLGSIHLDHIEPVLNLLVGYNIDIALYLKIQYRL